MHIRSTITAALVASLLSRCYHRLSLLLSMTSSSRPGADRSRSLAGGPSLGSSLEHSRRAVRAGRAGSGERVALVGCGLGLWRSQASHCAACTASPQPCTAGGLIASQHHLWGNTPASHKPRSGCGPPAFAHSVTLDHQTVRHPRTTSPPAHGAPTSPAPPPRCPHPPPAAAAAGSPVHGCGARNTWISCGEYLGLLLYVKTQPNSPRCSSSCCIRGTGVWDTELVDAARSVLGRRGRGPGGPQPIPVPAHARILDGRLLVRSKE